jgi:hypothetical protein
MPKPETVSEALAPTQPDVRRLTAMQAELQACLALSRATLQTLAALSPQLGETAEAALEDEAAGASREAAQIITEARRDLHRPAAARALERAILRAAETLPEPCG